MSREELIALVTAQAAEITALRAVNAELAMPNGDWAHAKRMSAELTVARQGVLKALEETSRRYPTVAEEAPALALDAAKLASESVSS